MMLFGLGVKYLDKLPIPVGMAVSAVLFTITQNVGGGTIGIGAAAFRIPQDLFYAGVLFPLGFTGLGFASGDFFPLMPWFFLFLGGTYFGIIVKNGDCPGFFYKTRVKFLARIGRYTIWIYLLHVPIAMLILWLIFGYLERGVE
jgi:uncharacterized membrane protein